MFLTCFFITFSNFRSGHTAPCILSISLFLLSFALSLPLSLSFSLTSYIQFYLFAKRRSLLRWMSLFVDTSYAPIHKTFARRIHFFVVVFLFFFCLLCVLLFYRFRISQATRCAYRPQQFFLAQHHVIHGGFSFSLSLSIFFFFRLLVDLSIEQIFCFCFFFVLFGYCFQAHSLITGSL